MIESGSARPTISVVLISYNDEKRLPTAIRSVLAQTFQDLEVIVADDASSDGTAGVVRSFSEADSRVRYVCLPENSGGCGAPRNTGTKIATGEWIFYLDSDDEIEPDAFENLVAAGNETGADVVSGAIRREFVGTARAKVWHPELFEEPLVIDLNDYVIAVGGKQVIKTISPDGEALIINYAVPNKNQCKECHSKDNVFTPIGPSARNLNHVGPAGVQQIADWTARGILTGAPADGLPAAPPAFGDAPLETGILLMTETARRFLGA